MIVDFRTPIMVIPGHWNALIFSPSWLALNILEVPEGTNLSIRQLFNPETGKTILAFEDFIYSVDNNRLEIYATTEDEANSFSKCSEYTKKILTTLKHTPTFGLGINFNFLFEGASPEKWTFFECDDALRNELKLKSETNNISYVYKDGVDLNLTKETVDDMLNIRFNFHHKLNDLENFNFSEISELYNKSKDFIRGSYKLDNLLDIRIISFDDNAPKEPSEGV